MPSLCLEYSSEGLCVPGGKPGKFPRLGKGLFLIQKLPREEMRLLLRSPPPHLSLLEQLCFAAAFPSAFPSLRWVGFCGGFFLFCPFLGVFHPAGKLGASLRAGPVAQTRSGEAGSIGPLPSPGSALPFRLHWGHPADVTGSGGDFGASAEIAARSLLVPSYRPRDAPCGLLLPSIPSKMLTQTGA